MTDQNLSFITNNNVTGTRDERAQLVAKIVQYQKRLQKLRRDLMRRKYGERSLEKSSLAAEKEEEKEVVVQLTASSSNGSETKRKRRRRVALGDDHRGRGAEASGRQ